MAPSFADEPHVKIDADLAAALIRDQFPQWSDRTVTRVEPGGWDNRTFRLGADLLVRMPSRACYVAQVEKEQRWLRVLAPQLPLPIPEPVARGKPGSGFPWPWSVYRWIAGEAATTANVVDAETFARDLAAFVRALHRVDAAGGPEAGAHSFGRGGPVAAYDAEVHDALAALGTRVDGAAVRDAWEAALAAKPAPNAARVWVHGDLAATNVLVRGGRLAAVIDFGCCAVGDPACDLTIAWTFLRGAARATFREAIAMDDATWARARGWALWKALIVMRWRTGGARAVAEAPQVLQDVLSAR